MSTLSFVNFAAAPLGLVLVYAWGTFLNAFWFMPRRSPAPVQQVRDYRKARTEARRLALRTAVVS
jgi:hypothetical protein